MGELADELMEHVIDVALGTAHRLQSWAEPHDVTRSSQAPQQKPSDTLGSDFAREILRCASDLPAPKVTNEHENVFYM